MDNELLIAAGTVDITPRRPIMLGGYAGRTTPFQGVATQLEANVLSITSASSRLLIVSTDLLYPGSILRAELLRELGSTYRDENLFLCASHTHYAPMTAPSMPRLGIVDEDYVRWVSQEISSSIKSLSTRRSAFSCAYSEGAVDHSINRRLACLRLTKSGLSRSIGFGPNPAGERDESVRIIKFLQPSGSPIALIWNYACHPCDCCDRLQVSAAFPGIVRSRLRKEFGDIPILFFQGFSGNVRPPFSGTSFGVKPVIKRIIMGPQFKEPTRYESESWSNSLAESVSSLSQLPSRPLDIHSPVARRVNIPEDEYTKGGDGDKSLCWHLIDCGGFKIAGINAEPVVQYRRLIQGYCGDVPLLTVGCIDQTHCYLPIDDMIPEGGYEVDGFRPLFNFGGRFLDHIQESIVRKVEDSFASSFDR